MSVKVYNRPVLLLVNPQSPPVAACGKAASPLDVAPPRTNENILRLRDCAQPDSAFATMVTDQARRSGVDDRALFVRTLLHLPRVATPTGRLTRRQIA